MHNNVHVMLPCNGLFTLPDSDSDCKPHGYIVRASSSYFFLFFSAYSYFSYFFSNFLLFFLFFSHFTYNKQIFVRNLNILSLFKYVVYRVHYFFFHKIVFIIPEMVVLIINKV